jgi:hypothetical protein
MRRADLRQDDEEKSDGVRDFGGLGWTRIRGGMGKMSGKGMNLEDFDMDPSFR